MILEQRKQISLAYREFTVALVPWRLGHAVLSATVKVPCPRDTVVARVIHSNPSHLDSDVARPAETNLAMAIAADKALEAAQQARIQSRDARAVGGDPY